MTMGKENIKEPVPRNLPPTPFLGHLKEQMGSPRRAHKTVCMIGNPEEVHRMKAQKNEGDMDVGWDIIVKDSERLSLDMRSNVKKSIFSLCYLFRKSFSSTITGDANPIRTLGDYSKPIHEGYKNIIELPEGNNVEDLTTRFLAQFFPPRRTAKLRNDILMFQQHQGESHSNSTRFKDLLQKVPHHGIDLWLQVQIFYDHVTPATRRTIDQSAGGKLRDRNAKESWALLEDLALYDNESWNNPRDFAKPVKAISLPQDVLSTSDRRLIELNIKSNA
ncbi:zinc finger, CCHC-type containing protein [Tanacetum coccineum]